MYGVSQPEASSLIYVGLNILFVLYFIYEIFPEGAATSDAESETPPVKLRRPKARYFV